MAENTFLAEVRTRVRTYKIESYMSGVAGLMKKGDLSGVHEQLKRIIPEIIGLDERVTRQLIMREFPASKLEQIKNSDLISLPIPIPEMVLVPAGKFTMGGDYYRHEDPVRDVTISSAFNLGKYPVTNAEYREYLIATGQIIPKLVANLRLNRHPAVMVSWYDAVKYCEWLSEVTGFEFRLPTEAEWEYAARGPKSLQYPWGDKWDPSRVDLDREGTAPVDAHPRGRSWCGIYDMSGNVYEWGSNWRSEGLSSKSVIDPKGPRTGKYKVFRGGSWTSSEPIFLRPAHQFDDKPEKVSDAVGFRVAQSVK